MLAPCGPSERTVIPLHRLAFHGEGLARPECVLAHRSGLLFAADWTGPGGVCVVDPATGAVHRHLARDPSAKLMPNGILLEPDGSFLLAKLDSDAGGVFRLYPDGTHEAVLTEVDGAPLPPTNFIAADGRGRLYVTVSTRRIPRHLAARPDDGDGFVALVSETGGATIVADGLGYANECVIEEGGGALLVNETFGRLTSRYPVRADGTLGGREILARYGEGIFPDGAAFDAERGLWITSIVSNTVLRVAPDGRQTVVIEDRDEARVAKVEAAFAAGTLDRALLDAPHAGPLKNISSLAFGGADLSTAYLGCLLGERIASFAAPVRGMPPLHYDADLTPLVADGVLPAALLDRR